MSETVTRQRLVAIMAADAVGYSRLMNFDEAATVASLDAARAIFRTEIELRHGRVIDMAGDSVLAVFETATGAVSAGLAIQSQLGVLAEGLPADRRMRFRLGVHLGDVMEKADGSIYGDGVNIAARLEGLAPPGGITVSDAVEGAVRHRIAARFEDLGEQQVKNIVDPVRVYRVVHGDAGVPRTFLRRWMSALRYAATRRWLWPALAALVLLAGVAIAIAWRATSDDGLPLLSVAVMPLKAATPADQSFADAFTQDLAGALSRSLPDTPVASVKAGAEERGQAIGARLVGQTSSVRYLLEGEVQRASDKVVATLRLVDARTAKHLWGSRIETATAQVVEFPDLPVTRATFAARIALTDAENRRLAHKSVRDAGAVELVFRARQAYDGSAAGVTRALALCESALRAEPGLAAAMHCKAEMIVETLDQGPNPAHAQLAAEADELTRRAVAIAPNDAFAWRIRGEALRLQQQWDAALEANSKAVELDPSRVSNLSIRGLYLIWSGRPAEVLPVIARSEAVTAANVGFDQRVACRAYIALGRFPEAVRSCERSVVEAEYWTVHLFLAAAYAQTGQTTKAAAQRDKAIARKPEVTVAWYRSLSAQITSAPGFWQQFETFMEPGVRKAGFPEK